MKDITVGYLDLANKVAVSAIEINKNFLTLLSRYVNVDIIPLAGPQYVSEKFKQIEKHKLDYLYIDSFHLLLPSFLLREKLGLDIRFILKIHTVFHWVERYVYIIPLLRKDDIIFAPSLYAKKSFSKISDKFNVAVIPNSLDTEYIQENLSFEPGNRNFKVISFLGRLTKTKGIGTLIRCMPEIIEQLGNVHLNVIGPLSGQLINDSPQSEYVKRLKREIKKRKLTGHVHFKGARFGLDKYKILSESDVLVNPTLAAEETFGIVNIEAFASGVPVISSNWAAAGEIVKDAQNGYLARVCYKNNKKPKLDTAHLVSLIAKVIKNKQVNLRLKKNAMQAARDFDYRKIMPRLVRLLKKKNAALIKNRWKSINGKIPVDFRRLFSHDFLFFLHYSFSFKTKTYGSLYKSILREYPRVGRHSRLSITPDSLSLAFRRRARNVQAQGQGVKNRGISERIYRSFLFFSTPGGSY